MSEPKLNIKEETSTKKTRSPPKKAKVEQTVPKKKKLKLLKQNPAPNKERHQMEWVQHMNSLKAQAEELVMNELIYS